MAAKYYIYARERWCEVDPRNGRVEGFKERARFLFFRGGKLELARTTTVLRGLKALADGKPGSVRDGPPLPHRKRRHRRRSRRERDSRARAHHGCCLHGRCDVNANDLRDKLVLPPLPAPRTPPSPRKRRIIYSDESPQHIDKSPVKEIQRLQKQTHNKQVTENVESGNERETTRLTRSTVSKVTKDSKINKDSSKLQKFQKQTQNKLVVESVDSSNSEDIVRPTRSTASKVRRDNKIEDKDSSKESVESSDNEETERPTRSTASKVRKNNKIEDRDSSKESVESSDNEETERPTRSTASKVRKNNKIEDKDSSKESVESSDNEETERPTRSTASKVRKNNKIEDKDSSKESVESSDNEETERPTRSTASKVRKDNKIEDRDSSKEQVRSPRKPIGKEVVSIKDDRKKSKKATNKNVSIEDAEKLLLRLSDSGESDTRSNCSEPAKELVIDEDDVIVLRRFMLKKGIGDLDRFDNDEEYKIRVFYKLNPLVTVERYKPLENLLRQKMTLKEFARNLGLRSVAEVTPEKRYRMRPSTKQARSVDSETDKENIVKPKRRKLWDNDKEHFTSIASRSSDIKPRQIPKPVLNEDSSKDTTDSDTEFKRKVREQLTRKSKQRASATEPEKATTSSIVTEKEQRTTRSSMRGPEPLKEQNKTRENKDRGKRARVASSEDVSRTKNKETDSSDSAFENSKLSPKKAAAKDIVQDAGKADLKRNKKGKFVKQAKKVEERVEKMKSAVVRSMTVQPVKIKASSVPPGREYTSLEDHAIVAWVSTGGRERRVNGNALWRELQAEYWRITGQARSWHSLRNRYLRYVLPSLGRLALPPHQVSRLRAAAAAGVMKARSGPARRNSIYDAPAVPSASTRGVARPPPKRPPTEEPPRDKHKSPEKARPPRRAPPPPSPTYSAVTRQFAARTRASLTSSPLATLTSSPLAALKRKK